MTNLENFQKEQVRADYTPEVKIEKADIVTAFDERTIGTKITNPEEFNRVLVGKITAHDFSKDRIPGQAAIDCPEVLPFVSSGVGRRTQNPHEYHPVLYRGQVSLFLKREHALPPDSCLVIVYTKDAYLKALELPDSADVRESETNRINASECTYVLVAVKASVEGEQPYSPYRFVSNLAGGNKEAETWSADEIRKKARGIIEFNNKFCTVADEMNGDRHET